MAERTPPDSPHVRSGVSSFSHISSPASYQFSRNGDASDEEGSSWSSDEVLSSPLAFFQGLKSLPVFSITPEMFQVRGRSACDAVCMALARLNAHAFMQARSHVSLAR